MWQVDPQLHDMQRQLGCVLVHVGAAGSSPHDPLNEHAKMTHRFRNPNLLRQAVKHPSYSNTNNKRLAWLEHRSLPTCSVVPMICRTGT